MSEDMNLSVNGQSQVPPGFRFHPTEEELLHYYLRKKVAFEKIDFNVIRDVDLNKLEPWDIQERCKIGSTPQNDWYFFSHKDKKYPSGTRTNRATAAGFWKATGRDKVIFSNSRRIGMRKTLVFYKGRAPHGQKSDWIMHEYRLDENNNNSMNIHDNISCNLMGDSISEEGWVVCRVFKKKNYHKALETPHAASSLLIDNNNNNNNDQRNQLLQNTAKTGAVWDQILHFMSRTSSCKQELDQNRSHVIMNPIMTSDIMHPPRLESPTIPPSFYNDHQSIDEIFSENNGEWATYDRFVASQLNGHGSNGGNNNNDTNNVFCFPIDNNDDELTRHHHNNVVYNGDMDMWNYGQSLSPSSSSDPLCHLSV